MGDFPHEVLLVNVVHVFVVYFEGVFASECGDGATGLTLVKEMFEVTKFQRLGRGGVELLSVRIALEGERGCGL